MSKLPRMFAKYMQTLVYFDGPQLALLRNRKGTPILAIAVADEITGFSQPYLANPIPERVFIDYLEQKIDLNFAMRHRRGGGHYVFDWAKLNGEVLMDRVETLDVNIEEFFPDQGFFSRNHTENYAGVSASSLSPHTYAIDGQWTASDFSRFYSKLADLYALFSIVAEASNSAVASIDLDSIINSYPFQGGGSYLSMFRDVISGSNDNYPLRVSKIKYASPGIIEVKGIAESLELIDDLVETFSRSGEEIGSIATKLREILKRDGVLGSEDDNFSNKTIENLAIQSADDLLGEMDIGHPEIIKDACGDRSVVYAKIALAIFRRAQEFHKFRAQGRMQLT